MKLKALNWSRGELADNNKSIFYFTYSKDIVSFEIDYRFKSKLFQTTMADEDDMIVKRKTFNSFIKAKRWCRRQFVKAMLKHFYKKVK